MASGDFNAKISSIEDVNELKKMLDDTSDLMERIALEDRLAKLGEKQDLPKASPRKTQPSTSGLKPGGRRLASHTFTAADRTRAPPARPSMMAALTATKPPGASKSSLTPDETSHPGAPRPIVRSASQAKEQILLWAQRCTRAHGLQVRNMTSNFSDGVAFCAIVHYYFPDAFEFEECLKMQRKERLSFAFQKAEPDMQVPAGFLDAWIQSNFSRRRELGGVPQLIDAEDIILMGKKPDYKVMFTYMSEMYRNLKKREVACIPE